MTAGRSPGRATLAAALLLLAAAAWAIPVWRDLFGSSIGVPGDPSQYVWGLAWFPHALSAGINPFLTDYLNHPAGVNLMWNTSNPAVAIAAAPITALLGPIAAYNLLIPLGMALSGWCAYLAARHFGAGFWPAFAAGLIFEFSPYELGQGRAHLSTVVACFGPLLAIVLDEALARQSRPAWRVGLAAGALAAVQLLVLEEYVATGLLVAVIGAAAVAAATRGRRPRLPYAVTVGLFAAAAFATLAVYPLYVQFAGPHRPSGGTLFHEQGRFVTDLANLVVPTSVQLLGAPHVPFTGDLYEWGGYIGLPLLVLLGWFCVTHWHDALVRVMTLVTLAAVVLSLGPALHVYGLDTHLPLPWWPLDRVPLVGNALPARLALFVDTGVALLAALALDRLPRRAPLAGLAALSAVALLPAPPPVFPQPVPAFFTGAGIRQVPAGSVALVIPWPRELVAQAMVWQAVSGMRFKMPGGYFLYADAQGQEHVGSPPTPLSEAVIGIETGHQPAAGGEAITAELRADRVQTVIVADSTPNRAAMEAFFADLLGRPPVQEGGVLVWRGLA